MAGTAEKMLARFGRRLASEDATIFYDVSALREERWTGIPIVAAGFAEALLEAYPDRVRFFRDYDLIETAAVADALRRRTGLFLDREIEQGWATCGALPILLPGQVGTPQAGTGPRIGIFPTVKPVAGVFDVECSIFHDISTLVMPLFHTRLNVEHHTEAMMADIATNDLVVTVSEASRTDLAVYLGVPEDRMVAAPNGVTWPDGFEVGARNLLGGYPAEVEPYLLVLGTREPRKNIMLVFDLLERAPELLLTHRFVFAGKMGWLEEQHALPASLEPAVAAGRILFTGFVSEFDKYVLLAGARATLYPSLFEGFGLPVLESLSVGTPCVASWSSSLPEVGGDVCSYFDPLSAEDFLRALTAMLQRRDVEGAALARACRERAAGFTWAAALAKVVERLERLITKKNKNGALPQTPPGGRRA